MVKPVSHAHFCRSYTKGGLCSQLGLLAPRTPSFAPIPPKPGEIPKMSASTYMKCSKEALSRSSRL